MGFTRHSKHKGFCLGLTASAQLQTQIGHFALTSLERNKKIGVTFEDHPEYYPDGSDDWLLSSGQQQLSIITQNVDSLHRRAGSLHVTELHGRTDVLQCMSCGAKRTRDSFHS